MDLQNNKCPIVWQSRRARRVAHSATEAEALALGAAAVDEVIYLNAMWTEIFNGGLKMKVMTDSKTLERGIHSSTNVTNKKLRIEIASLRENMAKENLTVEWIDAGRQVADVLLKGTRCSGRWRKYIGWWGCSVGGGGRGG